MIATSSQPGMFPMSSSDNPLTLVHTLPPPGSTTVSVQPMNSMPSTSGQVIPAVPGLCLAPVIQEVQTPVKKLYPCSFCDKTFGSRYNATRHEKGCKMAPPGSGGNQTNPEPILCPNCGKNFQTHDGMTRHMRKKCKLSMEYSQPNTVQRWTGKKIHLCKYCGKQFSTKWNAIRHENLFHTTDEPVLPSLVYVSQNQQQDSMLPRKPERYCRFCGSYFSTKYNAIRHEKICTRVNISSGTDAEAKTDSIPSTPKVTSMEMDTSANLQPDVEQSQQAVLQVQTPTQQQQQIVLHQQQRQQQQNQVQQQVQVQQQSQQQQQLNQQQIQQLRQAVVQQRQQQSQIQQHEVQQQTPQLPQLVLQQQIPAQHSHQQQTIQLQHQTNMTQQTQQINITPQQVVFFQPYHVCKFCNKQMDTKCDPTPIMREDLQNGTINANQFQGASFQLQTAPINPAIVNPTIVSLPTMLALPQNITIPIQTQSTQRTGSAQQQIVTNSPQIITQQQVQNPPQQIQHQIQLHPQNLQTQQVVAQVVAQPQQVQPQQIQPTQTQMTTHSTPNPQQRQMPVSSTQPQLPPRASPTSISANQKPHGCKFCSKHFATKWYLDQHEKIHTGQAVTCNVCSKSFVTRWHLDKHVRVHMAGNKKKRDVEQSEPGETSFSTADAMITVSEGAAVVQQATINGAQDVMVVPLNSFNVTTENRGQLPQFGLSPLAEEEQDEK